LDGAVCVLARRRNPRGDTHFPLTTLNNVAFPSSFSYAMLLMRPVALPTKAGSPTRPSRSGLSTGFLYKIPPLWETPDLNSLSKERPGFLFALFALLNALAVFWFFGPLAPWQGWLDADNAVPYLMTREPWHLQDFYYWGAMRFGSVYVVLWKLFASPFTASPAAFYFGHVLLFFNGLGVWLLCFETWTARWFFLAFFLPLSLQRVLLFQFPGHLYGMLFVLQGIFFFTLLRGRGKSWPVWLGVLSGLIYWQHELAGMGNALIAYWVLSSIREKRGYRRFFAGLIPLLVFCELARQWAKRWPVDHHFSLNQWDPFIGNVGHFLRNGLPLFGPFPTALLLWWGLVISCAYAFLLPRSTRLEAMGRAVLVACLFWVLVVLDSRWFVLNGRSDKYFAFIWPVALFALFKLAESKLRPTGLRYAGTGVAMVLVGIYFTSADSYDVLRKDLLKERQAYAAELAQHVHALQADRCRSYLSTYWRAYPVMAFTHGALIAGAPEYPRNPLLLQASTASADACVSKESVEKLEGKKDLSNCRDAGSWLHCP
jgi:hypothetical protein